MIFYCDSYRENCSIIRQIKNRDGFFIKFCHRSYFNIEIICGKYHEKYFRKGVNFMKLKQWIYDFWNDESGIGVVEMILILVVLIGIVLIFKDQLKTLVGNIFKEINSKTKSVYQRFLWVIKIKFILYRGIKYLLEKWSKGFLIFSFLLVMLIAISCKV